MTTQTARPSSPAAPATQPSPLPPVAQIYQLARGFRVWASMQEPIQPENPDKLQSGPQPVAELARASGLNEDALYRMLRALASVGVFAESAPRTFSNSVLSEPLRRSAGPLRGVLDFMTGPLHFRVFEHFHHAVRTGETLCQPALGVPMVWDYFAANADEAKVFDDAMTAF